MLVKTFAYFKCRTAYLCHLLMFKIDGMCLVYRRQVLGGQLTGFCVTVSVIILTGPKGGIVPVWQVPGPFPYQQASLCQVLIKVLSVMS